MTLYHTLAGGTLAVVAILHSVLGELAIIRPLLADERWDVGLPRAGVNRVLRFAWHLTTIAWIGLAAAAMGYPARSSWPPSASPAGWWSS